MRALVINLASATERMGFMAAQLEALGLPWERIEAVTPETLTPGPEAPVWRRWQRPMRVTEMALCASHMRAWERIVDLGAPCLVFEDDAMLARDLAAFLARLEALEDVDHISLETRSRKKLVGRDPHLEAPMRRLYQDRTGAAAMVIWPKGAEQLLREAGRAGAPADALISSTYALRSYQADPALSIQLDQAEAYGVPQAIATRSQVDAVTKPPMGDVGAAERAGYRLRRVAAQGVMFGRMIRFARVAERRFVEPVEDWVEISLR